MIAAGKLDRQLRIEALQTTGADALNQPTTAWVPLATVWAQVAQLTTAERNAAGQVIATQARVFIIRYRDDVYPGEDRAIVFEGRRYDIAGVEEIGRREGLRVLATARAEEQAAVA